MQPPRSTTPSTVADVLTLLTREPGRPRITWYGRDGERVELSGAVLANWVTKTTNLLVEELDAAPGGRALVDLPAHWRTLTWTLAVWRSGACVVTSTGDGSPTDGTPVDVVVTHRPADVPTAAALVAVALPALARSWPGDLPPGALDAASSVMTYADVLGWVPPTDPGAAAVAGDLGVTHADLVAHALARAAVPDGARALLPAGPDAAGVDVALAALGVWARDGSLVLVEHGADPATTARLRTSERVTADLA